MKNKTVVIPISKDKISFLADPTGKGHQTIYAFVKMDQLPMDLPLNVNPRAQDVKSRVARQIESGLVDESGVFHLLNRGLTMTAHSAAYNDKSQTLSLEISNGHSGLIDGGHSYAVLRKNILPYLHSDKATTERPSFMDNGYIRMEVMVGIKNGLLAEIARSRNTSAQVHDESLANLEGAFDWIKETVAHTPFGARIAYRENEDDNLFPIDIREIVALLTLFHPKFQDNENPPIIGYASKKRCLELFCSEPETYKSLKPILLDALRLYDYIHLRFASIYKEVGGFTGVLEGKSKAQRGIKLAKVIGVRAIKDGFPLYYSGETAYYAFSDGWLLPILAAMRGIVSHNPAAHWKVDPQKFFDKIGNDLVSRTLEASVDSGRNPNVVGKNKAHWVQLSALVTNAYYKLSGVDTEKIISL